MAAQATVKTVKDFLDLHGSRGGLDPSAALFSPEEYRYGEARARMLRKAHLTYQKFGDGKRADAATWADQTMHYFGTYGVFGTDVASVEGEGPSDEHISDGMTHRDAIRKIAEEETNADLRRLAVQFVKKTDATLHGLCLSWASLWATKARTLKAEALRVFNTFAQRDDETVRAAMNRYTTEVLAEELLDEHIERMGEEAVWFRQTFPNLGQEGAAPAVAFEDDAVEAGAQLAPGVDRFVDALVIPEDEKERILGLTQGTLHINKIAQAINVLYRRDDAAKHHTTKASVHAVHVTTMGPANKEAGHAAETKCYNCGKQGHFARECRRGNSAAMRPRRREGNGKLTCWLCGGGHMMKQCPDLTKAKALLGGHAEVKDPSPTRKMAYVNGGWGPSLDALVDTGAEIPIIGRSLADQVMIAGEPEFLTAPVEVVHGDPAVRGSLCNEMRHVVLRMGGQGDLPTTKEFFVVDANIGAILDINFLNVIHASIDLTKGELTWAHEGSSDVHTVHLSKREGGLLVWPDLLIPREGCGEGRDFRESPGETQGVLCGVNTPPPLP